jgi:hypothetical protein
MRVVINQNYDVLIPTIGENCLLRRSFEDQGIHTQTNANDLPHMNGYPNAQPSISFNLIHNRRYSSVAALTSFHRLLFDLPCNASPSLSPADPRRRGGSLTRS